MVVGAYAVMAHGAPRSTADLDFVIHLPFSERARVLPILETHGVTGLEERKDEWGQRVAGEYAGGLEVEIFFTPPGPVYDREYQRRVHQEVEGARIPFLSPEDLVLRKLVNCRLRRGLDFDDAISVLIAQGPTFDHAYLRAHCALYRVCDLFERAVAEAEAARAQQA